MQTMTLMVKGADITSSCNLNSDYTDITDALSKKLGYDATEEGNPVYVLCAWDDFGVRIVYLTHSDFFKVSTNPESVVKFMSELENDKHFASRLGDILKALNVLGMAHKKVDYYVDYTRE